MLKKTTTKKTTTKKTSTKKQPKKEPLNGNSCVKCGNKTRDRRFGWCYPCAMKSNKK
jgi:hypothetical protein